MAETLAPILATVVAASVILGLFYRRARRFFGKQDIGTKRFTVRIVLCAAAAGVMLVLPGAPLWAKLLGSLAGLLLAGVGLLTTKVEQGDERWSYVPNPYLGMVLVSVIFGRVVYRLWGMRNISENLEHGRQSWDQMLHANPAGRILILALLIYIVAYYAGLLISVRQRNRATVFPTG